MSAEQNSLTGNFQGSTHTASQIGQVMGRVINNFIPWDKENSDKGTPFNGLLVFEIRAQKLTYKKIYARPFISKR